jgi:hypothetical protein
MPLLVTAANIVPKLITKTPITPPVTLLPVIPAPIHPVTPKTTDPAKPMLTANTETVLIHSL